MEKVTYKITLDLKKHLNNHLMLGCFVGENRGRRIEVTLMENGKPYAVADTVSATMYVLKPGQSVPSVNGATIENNVISYDVLGSDTDTVGLVTFQLKLTETVNSQVVTLLSTIFEAEIDQSIANDSGVPSQAQYTALDLALSQVSTVRANYLADKEELDEAVETVEEAVETIEALVQRETTTLNTAEGYMNSAKTYSESALASKNSAKTSETNALASKNSAKTSEDNAKTSETNAKASELVAKASETNALNSKNSAKTSEDNAKASELNAKASETKAKTSETNSKTSELNAKTSETNSKNSEDNAFVYQTNAKNYQESIADTLEQINRRLGIADFDIDDNGNLIYSDDSGYAFSVTEDGYLRWEVI